MKQKGNVGVSAGQVDVIGGNGQRQAIPSNCESEGSVGDSQENVGDSKAEVYGGLYLKDNISQDGAGNCLC